MQDRLALLSLTLVFSIDKLCQCDICFTSKEIPTTGTRQDRKVGNEICASLACL